MLATSSTQSDFMPNPAEENADSKELAKKRSFGGDSNENLNGKKKRVNISKDTFKKPPISHLKKTGEAFLQDGPCFEVTAKLAKCRECRWMTGNQRSKSTSNIFCRFYAFRKLRYTKTGQLTVAGFCDPNQDPTNEDLKLWMPDNHNPPKNLNMEEAKFLLAKVADQFCDLFVQEKMAISENMSDSKVIAWKRVVKGVREMCDVCETSLFNYHWACSKCGFVVCIDCYKARKYDKINAWNTEPSVNSTGRDEYRWLICANRTMHVQERLMLTQIIAGDSLQVLGRRIHQVRAIWNIPQNCACLLSRENILATAVDSTSKGQDIDSIASVDIKAFDFVNSAKSENKQEDMQEFKAEKKEQTTTQKMDPYVPELAAIDSSDDEEMDENHSSLRNHLLGPMLSSDSKSDEKKQIGNISKVPALQSPFKPNKSHDQIYAEMMAKMLEPPSEKQREDNEVEFSNNPRRNRYLANRVMTMALSKELYPDVKHMWLCEGRLLRLLDPSKENNLKIFQQQWKRGQPVMVSHVNRCLNIDIWQPESFSKDFGEDANDLVNCLTGTLLPNQPMKRFWIGFDYNSKRIRDDQGNPILLKLKDWPPGEDFAETLPTRYTDLMKSLPLRDYTKRNGKFNLASRLPECFVKPDLGPKMYNAYGSAAHPTKGTTNLHLDISDAVNVMVYVGMPRDTDSTDTLLVEAYKTIDDADCDYIQRKRVRDELPGALWHIYAPKDANKIRDLLNRVAIERGERLEPSHDAIHDQSWYLDNILRERLSKEYGVEGYPIVQCLGDAIFIPAGAPHQVRNLLNCIKVAEDFVSPENVSECFHLTHEFRALSNTHSNHEDKLQIKNIIYHAIKDALSVLSVDAENVATVKETSPAQNIAMDATNVVLDDSRDEDKATE